MAAVRRGAWVALRYVTSLYVLGVIVQFFLVGVGLFGMKDGATIDNADSLNAHRDLGWALSDFGAGLMLILALLAWPKPRKLLGLWILLAVLAFVQPLLAAGGDDSKYVGMLHPVNALLVLGLSAHLARYAWASRKTEESAAAPAAVPSG
ncbi:MAG TPA: hypothetical protein VFU64_04240 [Gaiellaceae bacterium]|nr:hypothetical protein [Gaiellaceae bacterium]